MNKIKLLEFQQRVVEKGVNLLNKKGSYVFQSPTGTGKTFIAANLVNEFIKTLNPNEEYTFLHFSPSKGALNEQNALKFEEYITSADLRMYKTWSLSNAKQLTLGSFQKNVIHFFGWDQLIKSTNTATGQESERGNWYDVLTTTLNKGTKIVIIIDEQHLNKNSKATSVFINDIERIYENYFEDEKPIRIEMSATISLNESKNIDHRVYYSEAVEEELVKKAIKINEDLSSGVNTQNEILIRSAIDKREEIVEAYNRRQITRNGKPPLIVIQLPDKTTAKKDISLEIETIERYVLSHELMHKNHVAVWLSDRKETLDGNKVTKDDIENNEDISILIFKQAVATGWDIPRANIWVKLRNDMDKAFETQTLGRVLRNQFKRYFDDPLIDNAFIYTNDEKVKEEIDNSFGTENESSRKVKIVKKSEISGNKKDKLTIVEYDENEINIENVIYDLKNYLNSLSYIEKLKHNINEYHDGLEWNYEFILSGSIENEEQAKDLSSYTKKYVQTRIDNTAKLTLYQRYNEFSKSFNNKFETEIIFELINDWSSQFPDSRFINKAYKYFFENKEYKLELIKDINEKISELTNNNLSIKLKEFTLKEEVDIFENYINFINERSAKFDERLFYQTSLNNKFADSNIRKDIFQSDVERELYKELVSPVNDKLSDDIKYFIYNQTDSKQYYYISYLDSSFKLRKYFPDFIVVKNDSIFLLDTKTYGVDNKVYGDGATKKMESVNALLSQGTLNKHTDKKIKFGYVFKKLNNWFVDNGNEPFLKLWDFMK